jgi:hypothetical protein
MSAAADRVRRFRERQATGKIALRIECDEIGLIEVLHAARLIDRNRDLERADLEQGLERLIEVLVAS